MAEWALIFAGLMIMMLTFIGSVRLWWRWCNHERAVLRALSVVVLVTPFALTLSVVYYGIFFGGVR